MGYAPATFTAKIQAGKIERVTLELSKVAFDLPQMDVVDTVDRPWLRTFERRRATDGGVYFTRQDIVRSQVRSMSDLLRHVSGVEIQRTRYGTRVVIGNGFVRGRPCVPQLFVHSMNYSGEVNDFSPDDIEAMEVYTSLARVPVELQTARAQSCGAIVLWTREPPPPGSKGGGGEGPTPRYLLPDVRAGKMQRGSGIGGGVSAGASGRQSGDAHEQRAKCAPRWTAVDGPDWPHGLCDYQ